jgi:hypothetical protein
MSLLGLAQQLQAWPSSTAIRETLWYPIIESVHVLGIVFVLGTAGILDLRLLGRVMQRQPVSQVARQLLPWTFGGFAIMMLSGLILVYTEPVKTYHSFWAPIKLALLILAGLNAWIFQIGVYRSVDQWDNAAVPPLGAKLAGVVSLVLWVGIVMAGRLIAY